MVQVHSRWPGPIQTLQGCVWPKPKNGACWSLPAPRWQWWWCSVLLALVHQHLARADSVAPVLYRSWGGMSSLASWSDMEPGKQS